MLLMQTSGPILQVAKQAPASIGFSFFAYFTT